MGLTHYFRPSAAAFRGFSLSARNWPYAALCEKDVQKFERIIGAESVFSSQNGCDLAVYNSDWMGQFFGKSKLVLKPNSTEHVRDILGYCHEKKLALCVQGGNTGLVGGSVPVFDEIVLNLSKMNEISDFDPHSGVVTCQAGCILQNLDDFVCDRGYMVPVDLGARGSCQIGGNLSTAAGGVRFARYGSLHAWLIGLEVVGPGNGRSKYPNRTTTQRIPENPNESAWILDSMSRVVKDNTGPHLAHLFVGAEGQFGVITRLRLLCPPRPSSVNVAFVGTNSFELCLKILQTAKKMLAEILSSCELLDRHSIECVQEHLKFAVPFDPGRIYEFYILLETMGSNFEHDRSKIEKFLDFCLNEKLIENGCLAQDTDQANKIWRLREDVSLALRCDGHVYKMDLSLPTKNFYAVVQTARGVLGPLVRRVVGYGHLADGNVHLNVTCAQKSSEVEKKLFPYIYEWTSKNGGSISAEHGIGQIKRKFLNLAKSQHFIDRCVDLKRTFDPKWILNPRKGLPDF